MFYLERLPCPVLVTDCSGLVLHTNLDFRNLVGPSESGTMDRYFPPASCIFLQTHAWPLLFKDSGFSELYMQLLSVDGQRIPVMTNARVSEIRGTRVVIWLFFVAKERQRFESELLQARQQAQDTAAQLTEVNGELMRAYAQLAAYTAEVKTEADQLAYLSHTDHLTGLGNRRALLLKVDRWIKTASDQDVGSLLLIDIDFFKQVNDRLGHAEGDRVLCHIASQLQNSARAQDSVVRYGGEEFVVWLPYSNRRGAELTAQRLHDQIAQAQVCDQQITVSIGLTTLTPQHQETTRYLERLLSEADTALYEAKSRGRNRTICFDDL
ncbi:GGDEF domain-containing protein [Pseudomonas spirodelae]|uniref:diguanylate cyclase n=1 Tax=Pseudomonas spirodelae TaxID=3101751 RepID=A0ABU5P867_9PSED|nr:GGDEF domain-containing protein [Pseudomonas sp. T5W1]MEA1605856.1 GGDEF domain-containing protein [Pseudomonas sp. T5W1]